MSARLAYPLKMSASLKRAAERLASEDGVSLNHWINIAVAQKSAPWRRPSTSGAATASPGPATSVRCSTSGLTFRPSPTTSSRRISRLASAGPERVRALGYYRNGSRMLT